MGLEARAREAGTCITGTFFIKDKIDNDGLKIKWCNTDEMIADFLTKPTQGTKFMSLRAFIMNEIPSDQK